MHQLTNLKHLTFLQLKVVAIVATAVVTLTSCLTPKKMDKWINKEYEGANVSKIKSSDYIVVKTDNLPQSDKISTSQKGGNSLLPAVFYWRWKYSTVSTLNPYIPLNNVSSAITQYANTKGLKQKLNGQRIELSFEKVPNVLSITDKGSVVYLILFYITTDHIYIKPENESMIVSYRILKDDTETKKGSITITNKDKPVSLKVFQSVKKMTWNYLEESDNNMKAMGKEVVDKLLKEI
jgi:hypothetical protein